MDAELLARVALSLQHDAGRPEVAAAIRAAGAVAAQARQPDARRWRHRAAGVIRTCRAAGIDIHLPGGAGWPSQVDQLAVPPLVLYTRGAGLRRALLRSVAMVGSRAATPAGRRIAFDWASRLAAWGFTVVSGGAFGIDAASHAGALSAGGSSVAVLAGGVDIPTPRGHATLFDAMAECGALVSEAPPGRSPSRHGFLVRNRLIAALTPAVVVVQAQHRSGALATARRAADLHRVVLAVPGHVDDAAHHGCHALIRDGCAVLAAGPEDVAELALPVGTELPVGDELSLRIRPQGGPSATPTL